MEKYQIGVITGTRAEYGLLRPLLFRFRENDEIELKLIVTGSHLNDKFGFTQREILKDGFEDFFRVPIPLGSSGKEDMAKATGVALERFSDFFRENSFELVIVLGDRYEILAVTIAAFFIGIPVAHISGGDITEGAIDDAIRHCITKMSCLHFPGCEQSAKRIIQMGEQPNLVHNVGELGVENCLSLELFLREELAENLSFQGILGEYAVVTFHPVTLEKDTAKEQVYELIAAMDAFPQMSYLITMANADAGGQQINDIWKEEGEKRDNWLVVQSLGVVRYISAMKYATLVLGNSSSGIVEAPAIGTPTVDIGMRQKGRMMAESVIHCSSRKADIIEAIKQARQKAFHSKKGCVNSFFGDGSTSYQIEKIVLEYLKYHEKTLQKHFYDIEY